MAYKALYRTYRPSTFEEVAGQEHIVKTLPIRRPTWNRQNYDGQIISESS